MEEFGQIQLNSFGGVVRKKRSQASRPPKPDSGQVTDTCDHSPSLETPPSDYVSKESGDENGDTNPGKKKFNLNQCMSSVFPAAGAEAEAEKSALRDKEDGLLTAYYYGDSRQSAMIDKKHSGKGVLDPANGKSTNKMKKCLDSKSISVDIYGETYTSEQSGVINESHVRKVKLKIGGVMHTIDADAINNGESLKKSWSSDTSRSWKKQNVQGNLEEELGLRGVPWKDFPSGGFSLGRESPSMGKVSGKNASGKQGHKSESLSKSKRTPKRHVPDGEFDEDDEDDEIRYVEKLKSLSVGRKEDDKEPGVKQQKLCTMENSFLPRSVKNRNRSKSEEALKDCDYKEEELFSDGEPLGSVKRQKKELIELMSDGKRELTLTSRQRALQSSKDGSSAAANFIEFPNGLPAAPSRKQKEKLSEIEQQAKKAEVAERRRMQVEKAARESEAEAIRKILGQGSSRKNREEKMKKRREELAQEKAANALTLPPNTIRCVSGPTGTVITFSEDVGLPSMLNSKPRSYPPPREKCAGPSCTNPYRYREPKSKLPLCSLACYKAFHEVMVAKS